MWRKLVPKWLKEKINPITEMHVECLNLTYLKVIKWADKHPNAILMFTPCHPDAIMLVSRKCKNPIGLHVHLDSDIFSPKANLPDYKTQFRLIKEAMKFFDEIGIQLEDFASGHWNYNYSTFKACKDLGLRRIHIKCKEIPYALSSGIPEGLNIIPVHRHIHDYDLYGGLEKCLKLSRWQKTSKNP